MQRKEGKNQKNEKENNTQIVAVGYFFMVLFLLMAGYLLYFTVERREDTINNSYNRRLEALEEEIIRGDILAMDGTVLAKSVEYEDGTMERQYPYGNIFSHVVGIGSKGKSGIEKLANYYLLTNHSNLLQKVTAPLSESRGRADSVVTTLSVELQQAAYDALLDNKGAVVAIEPSTGRILAMVSKPDFDPNMIAYTWEDILNAKNSVLFNRAAQGLYPPGSTFKLVTLLEYMREKTDYADYTYDCDGSIYRGGLVLKCINQTAHKTNDLTGAFAKSCNSAFADIGLRLDKTAFYNTAEMLLFNKELPISIEYNQSSFALKEDADEAMVMQTAIGQGETLISPLHNCLIAAAVANNGILMQPYLVERIQNIQGKVIREFEGSEYGRLMTEEEAAALAGYMRSVVTDGTAYALKDADYMAAGKTGSAQYDSSDRHHSWFVGFAPCDEPRIAVCVLLEGGYSGVGGAHEVARQVFDVFFARK